MENFYQYVQRYRGHSDLQDQKWTEFAESVFLDTDFPRTGRDFDSISRYIEENDRYSDYVATFDEIWQEYTS
ncbi:D-alanyl-D-alanine carboxypeptidase [Aerococcus urinaehominis]|uniref:D-alanyl-D-alanine carboxypeptidase n=1 Tax=Aerococcus urinaehominis TaxID=128944 RepID=A0A0X8FK41_9LACT|nr:YozE family protein [Aerococcus urinaehominis]AMB98697.1 D-alanyl-D-alanine carboxypeptidase [Aerococcus urinaehominis]SDL99047.1 Uncharacterized protein YozE, UPF0346 family [Aerococcus urinaehominis]